MSKWIEKEEVLKQIDCWLMTGEYKYSNATHYLDKRISSIKPKEDKWISVKDRLPDDGVEVFAYYNNIYKMLDKEINSFKTEILRYFSSGIGKWVDRFDYEYINITHWMPLPEPPKEDNVE